MKYLTRDQVLLALGPVHQQAPYVIKNYKEDGRFPILQFEQAKEKQWIAEIGWKPRDYVKKFMTLAVIEMTPQEYESLPEDEKLV